MKKNGILKTANSRFLRSNPPPFPLKKTTLETDPKINNKKSKQINTPSANNRGREKNTKKKTTINESSPCNLTYCDQCRGNSHI